MTFELPEEKTTTVVEEATVRKITTTTVRYEVVEDNNDYKDDVPFYDTTPNTVALWDWATTKINIIPVGGVIPDSIPPTDPVSANDTLMDGSGSYTEIWYKHLKMGANDDYVDRPEGTAARLFMKKWGFFKQYEGKTMTMEYAVKVPKMYIRAGGSLGLGAQVKYGEAGTGVIWALDAEQAMSSGYLSPWIWSPTKGVIKPLTPYTYPVDKWAPVKIVSYLHDIDGRVQIYMEGIKIFEFSGRTMPHGIGLAVYNIAAVEDYAIAEFSNVRWEIE